MNKIVYIFLVLITIVSCSPYQKALKSDDSSEKLKEAMALYEKGKFSKAITLFEQIAPSYKGRPQGERMFYFYAMSNYNLGKKVSAYYVTAAYQFESFAAGYPLSDKREEARFLAGESLYYLAPVYSLDQNGTNKGIDKLQQFIDSYPKSDYLPKANQYVKDLRERIEKKAFENAKQFNTIAEWAGDFKAPLKALDNFLSDYPGTPYKEDALFYKLDTVYKYAINSIESKKEERLLSAKVAYDALIKFNSESKYKEQADKMLKNIDKELTQFSK